MRSAACDPSRFALDQPLLFRPSSHCGSRHLEMIVSRRQKEIEKLAAEARAEIAEDACRKALARQGVNGDTAWRVVEPIVADVSVARGVKRANDTLT